MAESQGTGATMFVGVIHQIHDPQRFHAAAAATIGKALPAGVALPIDFVTPDDKSGISIWQGPSVDAVRQLVESVVGGCSDTEYLELEVRGLWDRSPVGTKLASQEPAQDREQLQLPGEAEPHKAWGFSGPSGFALMSAWSKRTPG
jgi:hypothetical protein